jgi:hypothetical protein
MHNSFFVDCGMYIARTLCNSALNLGFDEALSARYSFAAVSASESFSGVRAFNVLIAVEYSLSPTEISVRASAVDVGLIAGITASDIARSVFHCVGVSGSSEGNGGKGVAFGETASVGRDMSNYKAQIEQCFNEADLQKTVGEHPTQTQEHSPVMRPP